MSSSAPKLLQLNPLHKTACCSFTDLDSAAQVCHEAVAQSRKLYPCTSIAWDTALFKSNPSIVLLREIIIVTVILHDRLEATMLCLI